MTASPELTSPRLRSCPTSDIEDETFDKTIALLRQIFVVEFKCRQIERFKSYSKSL